MPDIIDRQRLAPGRADEALPGAPSRNHCDSRVWPELHDEIVRTIASAYVKADDLASISSEMTKSQNVEDKHLRKIVWRDYIDGAALCFNIMPSASTSVKGADFLAVSRDLTRVISDMNDVFRTVEAVRSHAKRYKPSGK